MKMLRISRSPRNKSFQKVNGINKSPYLPVCTSYIKKRAQAVERVSDGKIIMLGYPTCGKEKDGMVWAKLYIPSTVKLGDKERFDKEQIGVKEPFPVTNCQFTT